MSSINHFVLILAILLGGLSSGPLRADDEFLCSDSRLFDAEGNGTLPARWLGFLMGEDGARRDAAQMVLDFVDGAAFFPIELGCRMSNRYSHAHVAGGWVHVAAERPVDYAVNAVCLSNDGRNAEIVALDRSGTVLHLLGSLVNKKDGIQFSGQSVGGSKFILVEDRRTQSCP